MTQQLTPGVLSTNQTGNSTDGSFTTYGCTKKCNYTSYAYNLTDLYNETSNSGYGDAFYTRASPKNFNQVDLSTSLFMNLSMNQTLLFVSLMMYLFCYSWVYGNVSAKSSMWKKTFCFVSEKSFIFF